MPMDKVLTTCGFCSCGCALYVESRDNRIAALWPSVNHPVSGGRLCFKGWNGTPDLLTAQRLRTPLIRRGENLEPASWEEAISLTVSNLKRISGENGPQTIGVIGSAKTTNEECYSLVKLARSVIGTPNVDGTGRLYDASAVLPLLETVGTAAGQIELNSIANAGSMLIVGANVMEQLPHLGSRIEDAALNGCKVVTADPRVSRLKPHTAIYLQPIPGTDLIWLRALLKTILGQQLFAADTAQMPGFEELRASLADADTAAIKQQCGLEMGQIEEVARTLAENPPVVVMFGLGVMQQPESSQTVRALADVAMLMGGSLIPLRGQNNAQGAWDMGLARDLLPGYALLEEPEARKKWQSAWDFELPDKAGMSTLDMLTACGSNVLRAMLVFGENLAVSAPAAANAADALKKLEFLAVADLYLTETAQMANVVFPACSYLEKDGTFTNIERRVQRVRRVVEPVGQSKSDLEIVADLADALGRKIEREPAKVMAEIAANVPQYANVRYEELDESWAEPWPTNGVDPRLATVSAQAVEKDDEYPFRLIASRINFHQESGTMSARFSMLTREYPETFAEMNEADADRLGVRPGRMIRISSKVGSLTRRLTLSDDVPVGCVHVPHYFGGDSPNALASLECDPTSGAPAFKGCAVKIEAVK